MYTDAQVDEWIVNALAEYEWALSNPYTDPQEVSTWIEENFYLYDTGQLLTFHPAQLDALHEALRLTEDGRFVYDTVIWGWPKKSAKSTVVAAVADFMAMHRPNGRIRLTGNDQRQADSRVGMYMRENIKIGKKRHVQSRESITMSTSGYNIRYPNGALVEMVPIDPSGEAGGNDDMIVFSELWGWKHKAHLDFWAELTISPNRHGYAQRWVDTYAGFRGESPVLEPLYNQVVLEGERLPIEYLDDAGNVREVECYRKGSLFATWVTQPHFPWQTPEYYASQARELTDEQFQRMHRNQWVSSGQTFVPAEWWHSCQQPLPEWSSQGLIIAMDAAVTNDCFALVAVTRHGQMLAVRYCQVWTPPKNGEIDFEAVEAELRRLCSQYKIIQIAYDKTELQSMVQRLRKEKSVMSKVWFKKFDQGVARAVADKQLHDSIRDRQISHSGEADLTAHITNANADINKQENQMRLIKRAEHLKIDAAVALSMAVSEALRLNLG